MHVHVVVPAGPRGVSSKGCDFILKISSFNLTFFSRSLVNQLGGLLGQKLFFNSIYYTDEATAIAVTYFLDGQHRQIILAPYSAKRFLASSRLMFFTSSTDVPTVV